VSEAAASAFGRFNILTVCTGNICRSPLAEHLLRRGFSGYASVDVSSAGTRALVGEPMTPQIIAIAHEHGVPAPEQHRARDLSVDHLREADLVIALTRAHRSEVATLLPRGSRHTFTLRELARLLDAVQPTDLETIASLPLGDTSGRFRQLVDVAAALRGHVAPPDHELDDDVVDPYRRGDETYSLTAAQLVPAVDSIVRSFTRAASATPESL
jgi:protein-tyrosine phosphatase